MNIDGKIGTQDKTGEIIDDPLNDMSKTDTNVAGKGATKAMHPSSSNGFSMRPEFHANKHSNDGNLSKAVNSSDSSPNTNKMNGSDELKRNAKKRSADNDGSSESSDDELDEPPTKKRIGEVLSSDGMEKYVKKSKRNFTSSRG